MSERSFIILCQIVRNKYNIFLKALANSEANNLVFINISLIIDVAKFFNIIVVYLKISCSIKEYNNKFSTTIIYIIILYLKMNDC
jgi:hypothetical protein